MISIGIKRVASALTGGRIAAIAMSAIVVAACAAPGAVSSPSAAATATTAPPTVAPSVGASTAPSASAAAVGPSCGTDPVELNAFFETGFDLPFKLSEEFTKQFPNVTWKISQDQFTNLMTATPRLLSGDNPPDLIRLPSMVSLVKDGLLKNLDGYATDVRLGQVAGRAARPEPGERGRDPRLGLAVRDGPELQPHRRLLQQGAGRPDRHDRGADDRRRVRGPAGQGQDRRARSRSCSGTPRRAVADWRSRSRT